MSNFPYDLYISCSQADREWVRTEFVPHLAGVGIKVLLEEPDLMGSGSQPGETHLGWVNCSRMALIVTPDYFVDGWPEVEQAWNQALDLDGFQRRFLPLLCAGTRTPRRLGALAHIDFTEVGSRELAWKQLLVAMGRPVAIAPFEQPARPGWHLAHPYAMSPDFIGRRTEHRLLTDWLGADFEHPLLVLRAHGGFGKSALAWHWLMEAVDPDVWPRVVWWSFYEADASFEAFLAQALRYLSGGLLDPRTIPPRDQVGKVLRALEQSGTLLVLDGFERALRGFGGLNAALGREDCFPPAHELDCLSPLAEDFFHRILHSPRIHGKVLLTTRHLPRVLARPENVAGGRYCEVALSHLPPSEAVDFFQAHGIRGRRAEMENAAELVGFHPLTLRLLMGWIVSHGELAGDVSVIHSLDLSGDLGQRQLRVLEEADAALTPARQQLLGTLACFRGPVAVQALRSLRPEVEALMADLRDLERRGWLQHDVKTERYDLHPIVRRFAYRRLPGPERAAAHNQLRDYFGSLPRRKQAQSVADLAPMIELYHHTVRAGQYDAAHSLYSSRLAGCISYQFGAHQLEIDLLLALFPDGEDRPPRLTDQQAQVWAINSLASSYSFSGQPRRAAQLFERVNPTLEKANDRGSLAVLLGNLADDQIKIGAFRAAEANLTRSIMISHEIGNDLQVAVGYQELGRLLACRGDWSGSEAALSKALSMGEALNHLQVQAAVWGYRSRLELLRRRQAFRREFTGPPTLDALLAARRALELAEAAVTHSHRVHPVREFVRAHWLLGASERLGGQFEAAERHLHEALVRCRRHHLVEVEADILVELARVGVDLGEMGDARRLAEEAVLITDHSGFVLPGADAHLVLAGVAFGDGDLTGVSRHASEAARLATCDGPPEYAYRAAFGEAGQWLCELTQITAKV